MNKLTKYEIIMLVSFDILNVKNHLLRRITKHFINLPLLGFLC